MKRTLSVLLALLVMVSSIPTSVFAADVTVAAGQSATESGETERINETTESGTTGVTPDATPLGDAPDGPAAKTGLSYLDENGQTATYEGTAASVTDSTTELSGGWYLVTGTVTLSGRLNVSGEVTLVLGDGAQLNAPGGIRVAGGNSLTITAQSTDPDAMGRLTTDVSGQNNLPAIGGNDGEQAGDITINGGKVTAAAGAYAAGIGAAGGNAVVGTITINGGVVEASAGYASAGIGGGNGGVGGAIVINGGTVSATATSDSGVAIGTGAVRKNASGTAVTISGGTVEAVSTGDGSGIGAPNGTITITGGEVTAHGGSAGIGVMAPSRASVSVEILISGGSVTATSSGGSGIGCGATWSGSATAAITISGGTVRAAGDAADAIGSFAENSSASFSTGADGHAVITAAGITGSDDTTGWNCIWFASQTEGRVYGEVSLADDLTVAEGQTLTVPAGAKLAGNGRIVNSGRIFVETGGSYTGDETGPNRIEYEGIVYLGEDGSTLTTTGPVELVTDTAAQLTGGWYLVEGAVSFPGGMDVSGDVYLILGNHAALTIDRETLRVASGASLTITAQSADEAEMGSLTVSNPYDPNLPVGTVGIGGDGSSITIWGGKVDAAADTIGIGGKNSTVAIRGGIVSAVSSRTDGANNYGIGGDGSSVTVSGGSVTTGSSSLNGYDIGGALSTDKPDGSNGNALLCAGSFLMQTSLQELDYISVSRDGSSACVCGDVTLTEELTLEENQTLTIPGGTKLTNNGSITNGGTMFVEIGGFYAGNAPQGNPVEYDEVPYLDEKGETRTRRADEVRLMPDAAAPALTDGWYYVKSSCVFKDRLMISGDVTLILADGATLWAYDGIGISEGGSLTVTAQSTGNKTGKLIAEVTSNTLYPGIGGDENQFNGSITINGGRITASAGNGAGIGGVAQDGDTSNPSEGSITINGGVVNATGGRWAAGIGIGGNNGSRVVITINGGDVTATGGPRGGAGIGTRENSSSGFEITITGGTVHATGQSGGAGIGNGAVARSGSLPGSIRISGGAVTAVSGGEGAAAIGDGSNPTGTAFSTGEDGRAVITADSITGSGDTTGWNCVWFESEAGDGTVCGSVTPDKALTVLQNTSLAIPAGAALTVPADMTITNNGSIRVGLGGAYNGAQPDGNPVEYQIGWDTDGDGEAEASGYLAYGATPSYSGQEPAKEADAQYTYTFRGWDSQIAVVTEAKLYTAQFAGTLNRYTVTLPENTVGYTLTPDSGATLDYGTNFTFTLTFAEGYSAGPDFAVKANGTALTAANNLYTVTVQGNTVITVEGVGDLTAPDTTLTVAEHSFRTFLNKITFGLFFKENVVVTLSAADAGSGLAELFYLRSETPLTEEELKSAAWQAYTGPITETAEDAARFVYYGKAADKAGNAMLVSSEGVVFDTTAPTFAGVLPDGVCYTTRQVEVRDANVGIVTLNGQEVSSPVTLPGDTDAVYTLVAADKAGNQATLTVTMKPISSLLPPDPATSSDKAEIEKQKETVDGLLADSLPDGEREALEKVQDAVDAALDAIEQAAAAGSTETIGKVEDITADTVQSTDRDSLEAAKEDLENALEHFGGNYTEEEKQKLQDTLDRVNDALGSLDRVQNVQDMAGALPDTVEPDDLETIGKIEAAKEQFDRLTDHEKELAAAAAEKLEQLLAAAGTYRILSGADSVWVKESADGLTIVANGAPARLTDLLLDGGAIAPEQYEIRAGSTIATLKSGYLSTLAEGGHTLTFVYENGQVSANFTVAAAQSQPQSGGTTTGAASTPQTGDSGTPVLWGLLAVLSFGALAGWFVRLRRKEVR